VRRERLTRIASPGWWVESAPGFRVVDCPPPGDRAGGKVGRIPGLESAFAFFSGGDRHLAIESTNNKAPRVRVNRQIRISPIRVIAPDGAQLGVMTVDEAVAAAQERGLDLVEVAPLARPPVAKIMDYGKFKFEQAKAARAAKKKQHVIHLKEVKYRPGIDDHDFAFKTRHAREFLADGNKVKVTMMYRGRQMAHIDLGRVVLDRVANELKDVAKIEQDPKLEGRNMSMVLAPK
jgi:translation initiation factor IF-3